MFIVQSILLGFGLAMDAFTVCIVNSLQEPGMKRKRQIGMAGTYALFQFLMPLIGWICVHTISSIFTWFQTLIPWIAFGLLTYIGVHMILESGADTSRQDATRVSHSRLLVQALATSIDALSVGFAIADYNGWMAVCSALIIGFVTLIICMFGLEIGKAAGKKLSKQAPVAGGLILILIGIRILLRSVL
ncbi:MAG: manganese efflux pump [Erysipelotrichaceae bacterium]|nr:manganese efflux pump [Erysipelotrichaceae bacterium]